MLFDRAPGFCSALLAAMAATAGVVLGWQPGLAQDGGGGSPLAGKQVRFVTMGGPGGGYDTYLRTLIPHLEKRTGAKILPVNETGAGGLMAMNRVVTAPTDGLTIGLVGGEAMVTAQLYKLKGVHYDVRNLVWIGRISAESKVLMFKKGTRYKDVKAMVASERPIIWAGSGKSDGNSDFSAILAHAAGMKSKIVVGYKGSGGINLAIESGEADARVVSDESAALFTRGGKFEVVAILDRDKSDKFPAVPTVFEQVRLSPAGERLLEWRAAIASLGRLVMTTKGSPADRIDALRRALKDTLADSAVVAEIKSRRLTPGYAGPEQVEKIVSKSLTMLDEPSLREVREVVLDKYF
jgi:tripartite-type tricarboxylate transporter receptor subunit TctC